MFEAIRISTLMQLVSNRLCVLLQTCRKETKVGPVSSKAFARSPLHTHTTMRLLHSVSNRRARPHHRIKITRSVIRLYNPCKTKKALMCDSATSEVSRSTTTRCYRNLPISKVPPSLVLQTSQDTPNRVPVPQYAKLQSAIDPK